MARKVGVTLNDVVKAASEVADQEGLSAVTLSRVAGDLGVRSPSLYAHVDGIGGLRRALQVHAAGVLADHFREAVAGSRGGGGALAALARCYRTFALKHPGLLDTLLPAPSAAEDHEVAEAMAEPARVVAQAVIDAGIPEQHAVNAVRYLRSAVHGFVVLEKGGGFGLPEDPDESFEAMVEMIVGGIRAIGSTPVHESRQLGEPNDDSN